MLPSPSNRFKSYRRTIMLDHVSIGVRDIAKTKAFYDAALTPLGYSCLSEGGESLGYGAKAIQFWIGKTAKPVAADAASGLHFCFQAPNRAAVDQFYGGALKAGGRENGK